jgi:hypothetical protein
MYEGDMITFDWEHKPFEVSVRMDSHLSIGICLQFDPDEFHVGVSILFLEVLLFVRWGNVP